ncbi:MAG: ferritin-like domain-containing protein, partial [Pseudomonadota bacterium]|nr:ferritin-like domain-containing protein [Pseudomonadota bacterium]
MIEVDRYGQRSSDFDKIISDTHAHFWDPLDTKYIDFSENFDVENKLLMPEEFLPELQCPSVMKLDKKSKIKLANESFRWQMSAILHGEQGALNLSASLCHILKDQGAQEYAANQAREEARHVTGFAKYINSRWGKPLPVGQTLGDLLSELVNAPEVYKKIVGMQILVEGLAMGAFATI